MNKIGKFLILITAIGLVSCVRVKKYESLKHDYDSLAVVYAATDSSLESIVSYLDTLASSIDSISLQEQIFRLAIDENGRTMSKKQRNENFQALMDLIKRQRERINRMETEIANNEKNLQQFQILIKNLYAQLDAKEAEISTMRKEIVAQRKEISSMSAQIEDLTQQSEEQETVITTQGEILSAQSDILNKGYVMIGNRIELMQKKVIGVVGNKINAAALNINNFDEVDMRSFTEITINAKKISILTPVPINSYSISSNGFTTVLTVKDQGSFWSRSDYLIILTKN